MVDKTIIMGYKIVFTETNGIIEGYSISDINGPNETKANIKGIYNKKSKAFNFTETKYSILSLKSL